MQITKRGSAAADDTVGAATFDAMAMPWVTGRFYDAGYPLTFTTLNPSSVCHLTGFFVPNDSIAVVNMSVDVTSAGAANSVGRMAIYTDNDGLPCGGQLKVQTATFAVDATGVVTVAASVTLTKGWHWAAYHNFSSAGTPTLRAFGTSTYLWGGVGMDATGSFNQAISPFFEAENRHLFTTKGYPSVFPRSGNTTNSFSYNDDASTIRMTLGI
jgi:hypothetical protein